MNYQNVIVDEVPRRQPIRRLGTALTLCALLIGCSSGSTDEWGPIIPVGQTVTTATGTVEVVSLRCNPTECVAFQRIGNPGRKPNYVEWNESLFDSAGTEYLGGNTSTFVFMEDIPAGLREPMIADFPLHPPYEPTPFPTGRTIVKIRINGEDILIDPVIPSASLGPPMQWSDSYGAEVPIAKHASAKTAYGDFEIELMSMRCSADNCEITERVESNETLRNWSQYPVWQQTVTDSAGDHHSSPIAWPGLGPNWQFSPEKLMTPFTVVYELPSGRHLVAVEVPGARAPLALPAINRGS